VFVNDARSGSRSLVCTASPRDLRDTTTSYPTHLPYLEAVEASARIATRHGQLAVVAGEVLAVLLGVLGVGLFVSPPGLLVSGWAATLAGAMIVGVVAVAIVSKRSSAAWSSWGATGFAAATSGWVIIQLLLLPILRETLLAMFVGLVSLGAMFVALACSVLRLRRHLLDGLAGIAILVVTVALLALSGGPNDGVPAVGLRWRLNLVEQRYLDQVANGEIHDSSGTFADPGPTYGWMWGFNWREGGSGLVLDRLPRSQRTHHIKPFMVMAFGERARCEHLRNDWYWCVFT
jgi:hypothetical protein